MASQGASWGYLPPEIRHVILSLLTQSEVRIASYATVCYEWQAVVEAKTFRRLHLTPERLPQLGAMTRRTQGLVRYLWLSIELEEEDHEYEWDDPWAMMIASDLSVLSSTFFLLCGTLSCWQPRKSLALDISVYRSLFELEDFGLAFVPESDSTLAQGEAYQFDDNPPALDTFEVIREMYSLIEPMSLLCCNQPKLPKAEVVTCLILRRQTRLRWHPRLIACISKLFPRLEEFYFEPWRGYQKHEQRGVDIGKNDPVYPDVRLMMLTAAENTELFDSFSQHKLKKIVLFEDFNVKHAAVMQEVEYLNEVDLIRIADNNVSKSLAKASLSLEHLSVAFMVNAEIFFRETETLKWETLKSIVLTSQLLVVDAKHHPDTNINNMLASASSAAMRMPLLECLEIWNGGDGHACLFQYRVTEVNQTASLTWRGTWTLLLPQWLTKSWEAVGLSRSHPVRLQFVTELIDIDLDDTAIRSHGDAIFYLNLSGEVLRPISLGQIRRDAVSTFGL